MYGKSFAAMYTGSMFGAPSVVFAVWGYVISHQRPAADKSCFVELNPALLAATFSETPQSINQAIARLCSPDPASRSKTEDGRKLIPLTDNDSGPALYRVVNGEKYRALRDEEERRAYLRDAQRRHRAKDDLDVNSSVDSQPASTQAEAEEEEEEEAEERPTRFARVHPPTLGNLKESEEGESEEPKRRMVGSTLDKPSKRDPGSYMRSVMQTLVVNGTSPLSPSLSSASPDGSTPNPIDEASSPSNGSQVASRLAGLQQTVDAAKARARSVAQASSDKNRKREKNLANLQGKVQPVGKRKQMEQIEAQWRSALHDKFPELALAQWAGRERGQVQMLIEKYGGPLAGLSLDYVVKNWEIIRGRFLKGTGGVPSVGFVLRFHEVLVAEAQQWTAVKIVQAEIEQWQRENPSIPVLPHELSSKARSLAPTAKALGILL